MRQTHFSAMCVPLFLAQDASFQVAPQLTTMSPTSLRIGTVAYTLNGSGFGNYNGANTVVLIGGTTTTVSAWTDTQIRGIIPDTLGPGIHSVTVQRVTSAVSNPVTFAINGGSASSGRSARGLSNFMPVRGKATVSSYPTKLVEAGLPLLKEL